jgi:hypothetical protein
MTDHFGGSIVIRDDRPRPATETHLARNIALTGTDERFRSGTDPTDWVLLMQLLFVIFSGFGDVGLVAGLGHSPHKCLCTCRS